MHLNGSNSKLFHGQPHKKKNIQTFSHQVFTFGPVDNSGRTCSEGNLAVHYRPQSNTTPPTPTSELSPEEKHRFLRPLKRKIQINPEGVSGVVTPPAGSASGRPAVLGSPSCPASGAAPPRRCCSGPARSSPPSPCASCCGGCRWR